MFGIFEMEGQHWWFSFGYYWNDYDYTFLLIKIIILYYNGS